eukprot:scaffold362856_cov30-Prasinocladus_malaysianus.AAC.1
MVISQDKLRQWSTMADRCRCKDRCCQQRRQIVASTSILRSIRISTPGSRMNYSTATIRIPTRTTNID